MTKVQVQCSNDEETVYLPEELIMAMGLGSGDPVLLWLIDDQVILAPPEPADSAPQAQHYHAIKTTGNQA